MRFVAVRTRCAALWIATLGAFALIGCRDHERSRTEPSAAQDIRAAAPTELAILPPSGGDDCNVSGLTEADRLRAMLVVQTIVLTWDPELTHGDFAVAVPSP